MVSPLIAAACAAIPVVYITLPALRICLLVFSVILLICCLVWRVLKKREKIIRLVTAGNVTTGLAVFLGLAAGFFCVSRIEQCAPGLPFEKITSIKGKLLDDPRSFASSGGNGEERGMALMKLSETGSNFGKLRCSARGRVLVYFPAGTMPRLREFGRGAELYIEGNFLPDDSTAGLSASKNPAVSPRFRAQSVHIVKKAPAPERMRTAIRGEILARLKPKAWGGLASALLLGVRENLEDSLAVSFRNAGLSHILALSGMHLAFISAMLAFALKRPLGKKGSIIAGFAFIVLYVFLVGPQPSLVRAVIMYGLGSFLVLTGAARQTLALLSAAFLVQILWDPSSAYSVSFILSYLALAGILVLSGPALVLLRGKLPSSLAMGISASTGAFLLTAPVVAAFFGILRPAGLIAGLVAAPLSGIFMGLSFLWLFLAKLPLIGTIAGIVLDKMLVVLQFVMQYVISFFARFPGLNVSFPLVCVVSPLLVCCLLWFANRHARYRNEFVRFA